MKGLLWTGILAFCGIFFIGLITIILAFVRLTNG